MSDSARGNILNLAMDELRRRISEVHLKIVSGDLSEDELAEATRLLADLREAAQKRMDEAIAEKRAYFKEIRPAV
jgi:CHASE3 domain sensor protein